MSKSRESKIDKVYQALLDRLPATYPNAELIVHQTITELRNCFNSCDGDDDGEPPYAFCDSDDNTIHVSQAFYNENIQSMCWYFLHEIGHLYALDKYGCDDERWKDFDIAERYANTFGDRWVKRLKEEGWFKNIKF